MADLDVATATYQALGFGEPHLEDIPEQGVRAAFFQLAAGSIELIQPTDPDGAIAKFMAKRGAGFHHAAFLVEDLDATLIDLDRAGVELIDHVARRGAHNLRIAFVHPRATNGVLTELVQIP